VIVLGVERSQNSLFFKKSASVRYVSGCPSATRNLYVFAQDITA
jgi:hypothetical protein